MCFATSRTARLDRLVHEKLPFVRGGFLQKLFRKKEVKVNGSQQKADFLVSVKSEIEIFLPDSRKYFFTLTGCHILFEDSELIAFNKRAGLSVHAGIGTHGNTLREAADLLLSERLIIVHRLDRDTSGIIVLAKNAKMARKLEVEFRKRNTQKIYHAVISGVPKTDSGLIDFRLKKVGRKMEVVSHGGFTAKTKWRVVQKFTNTTLVEIELVTGRTHQIRIHFSVFGYPILGDRIYGNEELASRLMLHASKLKILKYNFFAQVPPEFNFNEN